jgi:hypothetical protein
MTTRAAVRHPAEVLPAAVLQGAAAGEQSGAAICTGLMHCFVFLFFPGPMYNGDVLQLAVLRLALGVVASFALGFGLKQ